MTARVKWEVCGSTHNPKSEGSPTYNLEACTCA